MVGGFDGSINIDSRISTAGFNADMAKVTNSAGGALKAIASKVALAGAITVAIAASIASTLVTAGIAIFAWAQKTVETLSKSLSATSGYRDQVTQLKTAFDTLKGATMSLGTTLLTALAPAITTIINWLVQAVNWASMFIAAMSGQKTVMQYVSGAVGTAADNAGRLAKNTKKAGEAAAGALASFDMLNVLQMADAGAAGGEGGGGGGGGGNVVLKEVPIDPVVLAQLEQFKKDVKEVMSPPALADPFGLNTAGKAVADWLEKAGVYKWLDQAGKDINAWLTQAGKDFAAWLSKAWTDVNAWLTQAGKDVAAWLSQAWTDVNAWMTQAGKDMAAWITQAWTDIVDYVKGAWDIMVMLIRLKISEILGDIDTMKGWFSQAWTDIAGFATTAWDAIKFVWAGVADWFDTTIWTPIIERVGEVWEGIKAAATNIGTDIGSLIIGAIDSAIDIINSILAGVQDAANAVIDWIDIFNSGKQYITIAPIGHLSTGGGGNDWNGEGYGLARGGVIPPNAPFMAMVGDNKTQKEIIAPEDMIRRIVREESGSQGAQRVTVDFGNSSMGALIRTLNPLIKQENDRVGSSMAKASGA